MATKKVSAMSAVSTPLLAADLLMFVQGGANLKGTVLETFTNISVPVSVLQLAIATGVPRAFGVTGGALTNLTLSTEVSDVVFDLSHTVEWATGALASQSAMRILAPTYAFVGASTLTHAATLLIDAAPSEGTNATITNSWVISAARDTDAAFVFGRLKIINFFTDHLYLGHFNMASAGDAMIRQSAAGQVAVNCPVGQTVNFSIGDSAKFIVSRAGAGELAGAAVTGPVMLNEASTDTNPTLCHIKTALNYGLGGTTTTTTLIADGAAALIIDSSGNTKIVGDLGVYNNSPVAQPTGVAVNASAIHAALVTLNLITA